MTAFPFDTGTGKPTDAAAASESVSATEIAATKGFWRDMKALNERLLRLIAVLSRPIWYDIANNALRVNVTTGTLSSISTISSITNLSSMGSTDPRAMLIEPTVRNMWYNSIRGRIS